MEEKIGKYSFGIGDRFAHQGEAQLKEYFPIFSSILYFIKCLNKTS
jgi:hypothetical protein